jgi:NAD(P)H-nitrite reductase large subunit
MINWLKTKDTDLVCYCIKVDKKTIIDAIKNGSITLREIKKSTKACTGNSCKDLNPSGKCCSNDIKNLIQFYANKNITVFRK